MTKGRVPTVFPIQVSLAEADSKIPRPADANVGGPLSNKRYLLMSAIVLFSFKPSLCGCQQILPDLVLI